MNNIDRLYEFAFYINEKHKHFEVEPHKWNYSVDSMCWRYNTENMLCLVTYTKKYILFIDTRFPITRGRI